jgi:hypothetical protein
MGKVIMRTWTSPGRNRKAITYYAWGYTVTIGGKQERRSSATWTEADAMAALSSRNRDAGRMPLGGTSRVVQIVERLHPHP